MDVNECSRQDLESIGLSKVQAKAVVKGRPIRDTTSLSEIIPVSLINELWARGAIRALPDPGRLLTTAPLQPRLKDGGKAKGKDATKSSSSKDRETGSSTSGPISLVDINKASRAELTRLMLARNDTASRFADFVISNRPLANRDMLVCAPGVTHQRLRLLKIRTVPLAGETISSSSSARQGGGAGDSSPCLGPRKADPVKMQVKRALSRYDGGEGGPKVVVGSWSVPNLGGEGQRRSKQKEAFRKAATVVRQFDVCALQGVRSVAVVSQIAARLDGWKFVVSPQPVFGSLYAVLWRPDKVRLVGRPTVLTEEGPGPNLGPLVCYFSGPGSGPGLDMVLVVLKQPEGSAKGPLLAAIDQIKLFCSKEDNLVLVGDLGVQTQNGKFADGWKPLVVSPVATTFSAGQESQDKAQDNMWTPSRTLSNSSFTGESGILSYARSLFEKSTKGRAQAIELIGPRKAVWAAFYSSAPPTLLRIDSDDGDSGSRRSSRRGESGVGGGGASASSGKPMSPIADYASKKKLPPISARKVIAHSEHSSSSTASSGSSDSASGTSGSTRSRSTSSVSQSLSQSLSSSASSTGQVDVRPFCPVMVYTFRDDTPKKSRSRAGTGDGDSSDGNRSGDRGGAGGGGVGGGGGAGGGDKKCTVS